MPIRRRDENGIPTYIVSSGGSGDLDDLNRYMNMGEGNILTTGRVVEILQPHHEHNKYTKKYKKVCRWCKKRLIKDYKKIGKSYYCTEHVQNLKRCSCCTNFIDLNYEHAVKGIYYCFACFNVKFITCDYCGELSEREKAKKTKVEDVLNVRIVCEKCYYSHFTVCNNCNKTYVKDNTYTYKKKRYCLTCVKELFFLCETCHSIFDKKLETGEEVRNDRDKLIKVCHSCCEQYYKKCYECEEYVHKLSLISYKNIFGKSSEYNNTENSTLIGTHYCRTCFNHLFMIICDYIYKPRNPPFFCSKDEIISNTLFFGFEIEVENIDEIESNKEVVRKLTKNNPHLYCKYDSSLENGFEIVSHPTSLKYFKENEIKIMSGIYNLPSLGFRAFHTTTCGMHVHLTDKTTYTQCYKLLKFFNKNIPFIFKMSQRNKERFDQWCNLSPDGTSIAYKAKNKDCPERHVAINLKNENTIEIRIFRSNLKRERILKNIEFCFAIYNFAKDASNMEMSELNFIKYVSTHRKDYLNLFSFLDNENNL